ncbi:hypothetical protein [Streptomyces sp. NPDC091268]|uniref:hypothetical protein n=1 Tax=Streptomyces sp. NPDC091268 TaxID=3365979 RepID=UPI003823FBFA
MAGLANELAAPLVSEELRLAQYRRVANVAEWITKAADSLHYCLDRQTNPDEYGEDD